jgi:hypothetical protein
MRNANPTTDSKPYNCSEQPRRHGRVNYNARVYILPLFAPTVIAGDGKRRWSLITLFNVTIRRPRVLPEMGGQVDNRHGPA